MRWVSMITFDVYVLAGLVLLVSWWVPSAWPWVQMGACVVMCVAIFVQVMWGEL